MFSAVVEADSVSPDGVRLVTLIVTMPRFILAEFNTHRAFSRNAASSRAVPVERMIAAVRADPFVPEAFGRNRPGMTAGEMLTGNDASRAALYWRVAKNAAVGAAKELAELGVHKQWASRLLEPFAWTTVVVTATDWKNFFALRIHPDAQPEMQKVATLMRDAMAGSEPEVFPAGWWHLPFTDAVEREHSRRDRRTTEFWKLVSVGRCARVSYLNHSGERDPEADVALARRLMEAKPPHSSPLEHVATPAPGRWANFRGWRQLRLDLPGNVVEESL